MDKAKRNIKPFDGDNYKVWKFRVRSLLAAAKVLKVVDNNPVRGDDWSEATAIAKDIIIEYLTDNFLHFAEGDSTPRQIFEKLNEVYERKSVTATLATLNQLTGLKYRADTPLKQHFIKFDELVSRVEAAGSALSEPDKICRLLSSLPRE